MRGTCPPNVSQIRPAGVDYDTRSMPPRRRNDDCSRTLAEQRSRRQSAGSIAPSFRSVSRPKCSDVLRVPFSGADFAVGVAFFRRVFSDLAGWPYEGPLLEGHPSVAHLLCMSAPGCVVERETRRRERERERAKRSASQSCERNAYEDAHVAHGAVINLLAAFSDGQARGSKKRDRSRTAHRYTCFASVAKQTVRAALLPRFARCDERHLENFPGSGSHRLRGRVRRPLLSRPRPARM